MFLCGASPRSQRLEHLGGEEQQHQQEEEGEEEEECMNAFVPWMSVKNQHSHYWNSPMTTHGCRTHSTNGTLVMQRRSHQGHKVLAKPVPSDGSAFVIWRSHDDAHLFVEVF